MIDRLDFIKTKNTSPAKSTVKNETKPQTGRKYLQTHLIKDPLIQNTQRALKKSKIRKQTTRFLKGQRLNRDLTKEGIMDGKQAEDSRCLTSYVIRELETKTLSYHLAIRMSTKT